MMRDKKCFEWAAGAVAYNSLSFDGVYPAIDISTPLNVTAGGTQDDSGREVAAGCCPTSEQDCLVGRRDLLDNGAAAGGFRSGFRFDIFHNICSITYSHIDEVAHARTCHVLRERHIFTSNS